MNAAGTGKVVVNRAMSLDGFIAGPGDDMSVIIAHLKDDPFPEIMAATGAMLVGRHTHDVAEQMATEDTGYDGGPVFVITHRPPTQPHSSVTFLTGDLADAIATAHAAAGGKDVEIPGADLATQCLRQGLVDEILVYVVPILFGDGTRFSTADLGRIDLEPFETRQVGSITLLRFRVVK